MTATNFTSRLSKCIQTGSHKWLAICPAHDDKSPSLSISEAQDGRVLIHCHAGCDPLNIVQAVGLELSDLFPPDPNRDLNDYKQLVRSRKQESTFDDWFIELAEADLKKGIRLSKSERQKYLSIKQKNRRAA